MRIVYIDDDVDDREFFKDALQAIDPQISCTSFERPEDGVDFLKGTVAMPDMIFIDINMPRMNGYQSVREIRSITPMRRVPIIMLTTSRSSTDITEFKNMGIQVLIKPNKMADLVHAIKSIFRQAGQLEEK